MKLIIYRYIILSQIQLVNVQYCCLHWYPNDIGKYVFLIP